MKKLRTVLAGCGGISKVWLDAANPDIEIVGLVDIDTKAAQARADEYHLAAAQIETDISQALDRLNPDIVFDCTIPAAHVSVTLEALKRGCHVFGEKPMADSIENAQRMVAAAKESGKLYAVMQNRRFDPNIRRIRQFMETDEIGAITALTSDFYKASHFEGFRQHMAHVLLLDMAIHTFDAARFLSQADAVSVYCHEWNPHGSWFDHDASAVAIFEMSNGSVYTYRGSWCAEGLPTTWESDWRINAERGSIEWRNQEIKAQRAANEAIEVPTIQAEASGTWHAHAIHDFVQCVKTGAKPQTICEDNIKSLAMVFSAIESATTGKTVKVEW